jgi:hypothetical protein
MSVTLFIQERSGDFNLDIKLENRFDARGAIAYIIKEGGYWFDGYIYKESTDYGHGLVVPSYNWQDENRSIFIPLHRIDRMEVQDV